MRRPDPIPGIITLVGVVATALALASCNDPLMDDPTAYDHAANAQTAKRLCRGNGGVAVGGYRRQTESELARVRCTDGTQATVGNW